MIDIVAKQKGSSDLKASLDLFSSLCKHDLNALDHQERRKNFKTPSRRLIRKCKLLPPAHVVSNTASCCGICGDLKMNSNQSMICCSICDESFHKSCVDLSYKFGFPSDKKDFPKKFTCENINITFHRNDIDYLIHEDFSHKPLKRILVQAKKLRLKRDDFANDSHVCELCKNPIPTSTKNHILDCPATGTPIAPAIKRVRLTEFDPKDKKLMQKATKLGEKILKINAANQDYHKGITRKLKRRQIFNSKKK